MVCPPLFKPHHYLPPLKLVEVARLLQKTLSGVAVLAINIDEDVGIRSRSLHVAGKHAHLVCVLCGRRGDTRRGVTGDDGGGGDTGD